MFFVFCGGAIGEIFFCIVIIIFMLFRSLKKQFLLSNLIIFISILILLSIDLTDIYVFRRFNVFLETVNIRRIELAILSLNILKNEPHCLIIGCGFNFFQDYYNFNIGAYPHNIILEILITYGLIITIIIFILLFVGLKKIFFSNSELVLIDIIVLYLFLLYFKSGSLISLDVFATVFYLISHSDFTKSFNKLSNL
jgi:hypothetical protein